jgi:hypothetical protein
MYRYIGYKIRNRLTLIFDCLNGFTFFSIIILLPNISEFEFDNSLNLLSEKFTVIFI